MGLDGLYPGPGPANVGTRNSMGIEVSGVVAVGSGLSSKHILSSGNQVSINRVASRNDEGKILSLTHAVPSQL